MARTTKGKGGKGGKESTAARNKAPEIAKDDSIHRVPSGRPLNSFVADVDADLERNNFSEVPHKNSSFLSTHSHHADNGPVHGGDSERFSNKLSTDRFRAANAQAHRASMTQGSQFGQAPEVEYVDLNGQLLDTEKLRHHNLLPGLGGTKFFAEGYNPGEIVQPMLMSPSSPLPPLEQSPMQQPMYDSGSFRHVYPNELEYANNIGRGIQERYAALHSEPTIVGSFLMPAADSQVSPQSHHGPASPVSAGDGTLSVGASPTQQYIYSSNYGAVEMPASYRVIEKRGCTVVSDLLLNPVTGAPVKIQES